MITSKKVRFEDLFPIITETVSKGNEFSFCAFGNSMLPFIQNGKDLVTLGPVSDQLRAGDIIFYRRKNGQFVLHRIVKVLPDQTYHLCGDNQFRIEKDIQDMQIIAKLVRLERSGKEVKLNSFSARLWCLLLPFRRFILHVKSAITYRIQRLHKN